MRAVVFHRHGVPEDLDVEDVAEPEARSGDAIAEVGATSINGFDPPTGPSSLSRTPVSLFSLYRTWRRV